MFPILLLFIAGILLAVATFKLYKKWSDSPNGDDITGAIFIAGIIMCTFVIGLGAALGGSGGWYEFSAAEPWISRAFVVGCGFSVTSFVIVAPTASFV